MGLFDFFKKKEPQKQVQVTTKQVKSDSSPAPKKKAAGEESFGGLTRYEFIKFKKLLKSKMDETADFDAAEKIIKNSLSAEDYAKFCKYLAAHLKSTEEYNKREKAMAKDGGVATGLIEWSYVPEQEGRCLVCQEYAEKDIGHGKGIYPVDKVPDIPHPGCWCSLRPVMKSPEEIRKGIFEEYFGEEAMKNPPPKYVPPDDGILYNPTTDTPPKTKGKK